MKISSTALMSGALSLLVISMTGVKAADTEEQARMREALRQKMQELGQEQSSPATAAPAVKTTKTVKTAAPTAASKPAVTAPAPAPKVVAAPTAPANTAPATTQSAAPVASAQAAKAVPAKAFNEPPPAALPTSKEARLAQLLQQYKTDQITPEQYHTERAKIVGAP
ncbi:MAG: hypothetical protein RLY20_1106 [Verrucomicrobiota bacterium]|jgi:hypothetical protein